MFTNEHALFLSKISEKSLWKNIKSLSFPNAILDLEKQDW